MISALGPPAPDPGDFEQSCAVLRRRVLTACRYALSAENRDRWAPAYGCCDRRYWAWKLVDFPEATFQRLVAPLAWCAGQAEDDTGIPRAVLVEAVAAGLTYSAAIQHADGSFDQAFPHEHSCGATAFLAAALAATRARAAGFLDAAVLAATDRMLQRAAGFLCRRDEAHGYIANHRAGAAYALLRCGELYNEARFTTRGRAVLDALLSRQSPEGWFPEYGGADPGYQTLLMHYLAQIQDHWPDARLAAALAGSLDFLAWFAQPDGSFGGEYGSRRTRVYYPGGIALCARDNPTAAQLTRWMVSAHARGATTTLQDIDTGNLAPLLESCICALNVCGRLPADTVPLPCLRDGAAQDFPGAGLHVRSTARQYIVVGAANGGVVHVCGRAPGTGNYTDAGFIGRTRRGTPITSQVTGRARTRVDDDRITVTTPFAVCPRSLPTPVSMLCLRVLSLTVMRWRRAREAIKRGLVRLLVHGGKAVPLTLTRSVTWNADAVTVTDELTAQRGLALEALSHGRPGVAIHMASARYYPDSAPARPGDVDVGTLNRTGRVHIVTRLKA
jgi:hypothetical protein